MERPKRPPTLSEVIFKTSAMTLVIAFVVFSYGITVFGWALPVPMARLSASLGAHSAAAMYFEREYQRNPTPKNLYNTLDRYIMAQNNRKVVEFSEKFFELPETDQTEIINSINEHWEIEADGHKHNHVSWANESSRIKSAYVVALIRTDRTDDALTQLDDWLKETHNPRHPNHAFIKAHLELETPAARDLLENYTYEFGKVAVQPYNIFAIDFLFVAHGLLGNSGDAHYFLVAFNAHKL